jgi:large subunit ribosomal protein L3
MPAILAKKLGMTQRFLDDGKVERVTVLEAGPCPVLGIRTKEVDGYEAIQLGFGAVREKALSKAELGHLKKADAPPLRTIKEFRDQVGEFTMGDTVTVEAFEGGQKVKISHKSNRMGGGRVTQLGLTIVELIPDQNLMLVRGPVPGPKGSTVEVRTNG